MESESENERTLLRRIVWIENEWKIGHTAIEDKSG